MLTSLGPISHTANQLPAHTHFAPIPTPHLSPGIQALSYMIPVLTIVEIILVVTILAALAIQAKRAVSSAKVAKKNSPTATSASSFSSPTSVRTPSPVGAH